MIERLRRALREFVYAWRGDDTERDLWRNAYEAMGRAWYAVRAECDSARAGREREYDRAEAAGRGWREALAERDAANARARVAVDEAIRMGIYWRDQYGAMGRYADALRGERDTLLGERDAARDAAEVLRRQLVKQAKATKRGNRKR
jgi:hypothetical protein